MDSERVLPVLLSERFALRFWSKVDRGPECWRWTAHRSRRHGYGRVCVTGHGVLDAHRAAWAITHGWLPAPGEVLLNLCRSRACVNPAHWEIGSAAGEKSATAKLTRGQVRTIKKYLPVLRVTEIARRFGVTHSLIQQIRDGKAWASV